jgi:small-conductance mechanosensitive channel
VSALATEFWGNTLQDWAIALGILVVTAAGLKLVVRQVTPRLKKLAARTVNRLDDVVVEALGRTRGVTYLVVGLSLGTASLELTPTTSVVLNRILVITLLVQGGLWIGHAVTAWLQLYRDRQLETDRGAATSVGAISFILQLAIWSMVLLIALSNLGVNITALVTGLGIGGIAVALALQTVISDLFASLAIVFDKPFVIGDFLIVGEHLGVVENVGLKTTRIRSLSGEQLVFANSDLLNSRIRNYGRMQERRVVFQIGVTYQTPQDKLEGITGIIRRAIEEQEKTRFDRSHFARFGDFALLFESVYYILEADYNLYMDIQERINLQIRRRFAEEGIDFAYPTQTLFLEKGAPDR